MRILAVSHSYPRDAGDLAGAFLERLYVALAERGHEIRVVVPADLGAGGTIEQAGLSVERVRYDVPEREVLAYRGTLLQAVRTPAGLRSFVRMMAALRVAIAAHEPWADVVHANWWVPSGISTRRALRACATRYVVTLHGTDAMLLERSRVARILGRRVLRPAAGLTTVSGFLADSVARSAGVQRPVVLPMPIGQRRTPVGEGGGGLVTVGRLTPQKRIGLAIEALAMLRREGRPVTLTIVGDGPDRGRLTALAAQLGVGEAVRFTGMVAPDAVAPLVAPADAFVFPAHQEGFGLAAAEALMVGVPVVTVSDGGGVLDLAGEGVTVAGIPDARHLADAVRVTLADPGARAAARRSGERWAETLAPSAVAARLETVLAGAAGDGR